MHPPSSVSQPSLGKAGQFTRGRISVSSQNILKMLPRALAAWEGAGREAGEAKAQTPGLGGCSPAVEWQEMENSLCFFPFKEQIVKKLQHWDFQGESAWLGGNVKREYLNSGSRAAA